MPTAEAKIQPRLQVRYRESIAAQLQQEFGYKNPVSSAMNTFFTLRALYKSSLKSVTIK